MDKCTKFKIFNVALLFCVMNFFLYRFFAYSGVNPFVLDWNHQRSSTSIHDAAGTESADRSSKDVQSSSNGGGVLVKGAWEPGDAAKNRTAPKGGGNPTRAEDVQGTAGSADGSSGDVAKKKKIPPKTGDPDASKVQTSSAGSKSGDGKPDGTPGGKPDGKPSGKPDGKPESPANATLLACPLIPPFLSGALATYTDVVSFKQIAQENPLLQPGGRFKPPNCVSRHRVAIVIPYRNREQHLKVLLHNLHPMLQRQQLDYGIFVVEPEMPTKFNRALLMNIGYVEAMKRYDYQCVVFHDVDLIPEHDHNIYSCPEMPRHLSAAIDKFKYRLPYASIFGGASVMTKEHMQKINGYSNLYFGWGGEDDDVATRIRSKGLKISRYPMQVARYRMIKHGHHEKGNEDNPNRHILLKTTRQRLDNDGLSTLKYKVKMVDEFPTHLHILATIDQNDYKFKL